MSTTTKSGVTLKRREWKATLLQTSESTQRCTVLLGMAFSGMNLLSFLVFQGKHAGKIQRELCSSEKGLSSRIKFEAQQTAWIDERTFPLQFLRGTETDFFVSRLRFGSPGLRCCCE